MNERDPELFEAELCRLTPAPLPCELQARLANVQPAGTAQAEIRRPSGASASGGWLWLRWLIALRMNSAAG